MVVKSTPVQQNQNEVETNTLSLNDNDKKSAISYATSKAAVTPNSQQPKDAQKAQDEIHATMNFVSVDENGRAITNTPVKSVEFTGRPGSTVYDALGKKDVYSYMLEDYPSYLLLPLEEFKTKVHYDHRDGNTLKDYFNDPKIAADYEQWYQEYKNGQHPLFAYLPYDDKDYTDQDLLAGRTVLEDHGTYTIRVRKQGTKRYNRDSVFRLETYVQTERNINYFQYRGQSNHEKQVHQFKNGRFYSKNDDQFRAPDAIYEALNTQGRIPDHMSSVHYMVRDASDGTAGAPVAGGTYGTGQLTFDLEYPAETQTDRTAAEELGGLAEWSTLDPLVKEIAYNDLPTDYKTDVDGKVHHGTAIGNPPDQNIMYYANRKFNVVFKDITDGDGDKAIDLTNYDYTDPKQMTLAANSATNPHNGDDNKNYQAYKVDENVYNNKLDALRKAGYVIVFSDVDEFNTDNLYNSDGTIKPQTYVVKVLRGVKEIKPVATATRQVFYKANSKDGQSLKDPITQEVTVVGQRTDGKDDNKLYVDATEANATKLVNIKTVDDINGSKVKVIDRENQDPINVTWSIDDTKTKHDVNNKFDFEKPAGDEAPETIGDWNHVSVDDINNVVDPYAPESGDVKTLAPVYLIYKQKASAHTIHKTVTRTIHYVTDGQYDVLQAPVTQTANLSSTYYTDKDGKEVAVQKVGDTYYVNPDETVPKRTWTVDSTGNTEVTDGSFDKKTQDFITVLGGANKGTWKIEYAAKTTPDVKNLSDKFAPQEAVDTNAADGTNTDVYLVYTKNASDKPSTSDQPGKPDQPSTPDQPDQPGTPDQPGKPDQPSTPDQPGQPDQPGTPDQPGEPDQPATPETSMESASSTKADASMNPVNSITPETSMESANSTKLVQDQVTGRQVTPVSQAKTTQLPQTGNENSQGLMALGFAGLLSALGLGKLNRKKED